MSFVIDRFSLTVCSRTSQYEFNWFLDRLSLTVYSRTSQYEFNSFHDRLSLTVYSTTSQYKFKCSMTLGLTVYSRTSLYEFNFFHHRTPIVTYSFYKPIFTIGINVNIINLFQPPKKPPKIFFNGFQKEKKFTSLICFGLIGLACTPLSWFSIISFFNFIAIIFFF